MGGIFISYRREDSGGYAGRIYDRLAQHFGKDRVFMDLDTLKPGVDFVGEIQRAVEACDVLIAVIGRSWLTVSDDKGQPRIRSSKDLVRVEILTALQKSISVVPILVGGASMPNSKALPKSLARLARQQAKEVTDTRFHIDLDSLIQSLRKKAVHKDAVSPQAEALGPQISIENVVIGKSAKFKRCLELASLAAKSDSAILLLGESGTGKELFVRLIHERSPRKSMPFVIFPCAAIPESIMERKFFGYEKGVFGGNDSLNVGSLEEANGGTMFLDEIGDMSLTLQAKCLRVLQEQEYQRIGGTQLIPVNTRFIAASNRDLRNSVTKGDFREDLFYRLNVLSISLPPLRERQEDIVLLADFFLNREMDRMKKKAMYLTPESIDRMKHYSWPGNVRELNNAIERAVVLGSTKEISPEDLGLPSSEGLSG